MAFVFLGLPFLCLVLADSNMVCASADLGEPESPVDASCLLVRRAQVLSIKTRVSEGKDVQGMHVRAHHTEMPLVAWRAFEALAEDKRQHLEKGSLENAQPTSPEVRGSVFEAVEVSLPLEPPVLKHQRELGSGQGDKNIVGLAQLTRGGRKCVVYGMGIADDSSFEQQMQERGCETHAFDCTIDPSAPAVSGKSFKFHNWCIGRRDNVSFKDNNYLKTDSSLQFKTMSETMKELGHSSVDLLKFDIEGFEWQLFDTELLQSDNPPEQLSFELHTQKANPAYVPQKGVHDKGFVQVNRLFRSLFDMGYRVTSKELNSGDPACAEFVAVKIARGDA